MHSDEAAVAEETVRVWLVERTYGDDVPSSEARWGSWTGPR